MLYSHWLLLMYLLYSFTTCTMTKRVLDHRRVHNQQRSHGRHHHRRKTSASPVTRLDELLRGPSVSYVQHQSLNPKQLETQKSLKNELKKLERRTRWVPPVPCLNCRSGYSLYSSPRNYGPNQVLYLQRLVQKLNSDVGRLHTSVDSLIRWKSSAEHNVQRLEEQIETMNEQLSDRTNIGSQSTATNNNFDQSRQVQALQTMVIELQSSVRSLQQQQLQQAHIPDSGSNTNHVVAVNSNNDEGTPASVDTGVNDLLNLHGRRLNSHDNVLRKTSIDITSLQHHLVSILSKNSKQDRQISFLRSVCSNTTTSVASIPHMIATENDGGIGPGQSRSIENLRRSYQTQEREINLLKRKVSESQSCCRDVVTLSRRLDSTVAHVEEARIRADESMAVIVLQDHKVNEVVGKLDRQRVVIQRLQESVRNQQHSLSVMNRNIRDSLNRRTQRINETLFANITAFMTSFENRVHNRWSAMSTQLERNNNTLQTVGQYLDQVSQQTSENSQYIEELETKLLEHVNQAGNNVTLVAQRLNMNERTLIGMMSRLNEIGNLAKVQRKAVENRIKNAETKILLLEDNLTHLGDSPESSSSVEESVVFLNSSFHRLRSALHRLSNRVDGVNTAVHKHSATDRRTKNRFSRIHSLIKEQNERSNNESMLLRRMINSDADSLRHTVALRLSLLSSHISNITSSVTDIASQRDTLYDHIMSVEQSLNLSLNRLQRNTDHIQVNLDLNHERMKTNDSDLRRKIYLLNETMNELVAQSQNGLHENLMEITNILNTRVTSVHRNFTNLSSNLEAVQRSLGDAETNINNVTNHYHDMRNHMNIVKGNVEELMTSQHDLQTRLRTVDQTVHNQMINISLNQENINLNKQLALNLHSGCQEERNATRQFEKSVQEQFKQIGENVARNQLTINSRLTTVSNKVVEVKTSLHDVTSLHNTRLMSLESLNGSWIPLFGNCNNNLALVRDDIRALQRTDGNFQVSLELHERALIEHRRLHTNLSAISEDVSSVINEHEVALHSVKGVVLQLNETLVEGEERIGEEIEAQLKRHMREVVGLRGIMRNFTSIVQTMISNRLDQEISIASVRMHQRGLVETVDSHTASLDRLNHDNIQIKSEIAGVGADTENNLRKITNLIRIFDR
uniref:uncharacterized protein LOC100176477 isoform X2 n=1 Tax=Ciona intestinalis TaxID=7719 RepID=UPI000EF54740|nr:uncharacterized protein LOC100176477 isoform X2 [Ciona intestinalis]|eukprot:XP_026696143.1 uncharacterized protein LOC100176477 isoform X2 [Ciona intestinalis]